MLNKGEFERIDTIDAVEIALRHTPYNTLEELREATEAQVLAWVQKQYPRDDIKSLSRLRGPLIDFTSAMHQEDVCALCREKGRYFRCSTGGRVFEVYPVPDTVPRQFYVGFRDCGYRNTVINDAKKKRVQEQVSAPKGFSLDRDPERRDIDA